MVMQSSCIIVRLHIQVSRGNAQAPEEMLVQTGGFRLPPIWSLACCLLDICNILGTVDCFGEGRRPAYLVRLGLEWMECHCPVRDQKEKGGGCFGHGSLAAGAERKKRGAGSRLEHVG